MSNLDDRINIILREDSVFSDMYQTVEDIKQAFAEAGYVRSDAKDKADKMVQDMANVLAQSNDTLNRLKSTHGYVYTKPGELEQVMTGAEWLERFEKELENMVAMTWYSYDKNDYHELLDREQIIDLARLASGVEG